MEHTPRVAVVLVNGSLDTTELLRKALEDAGVAAASATPEQLLDGNLPVVTHQDIPPVVIYDIAPPYAEHWRLFEDVAHSAACHDLTFLVTTRNLAELVPVASGDYAAYELGGSLHDLQVLLAAVKGAIQARRVAAD